MASRAKVNSAVIHVKFMMDEMKRSLSLLINIYSQVRILQSDDGEVDVNSNDIIQMLIHVINSNMVLINAMDDVVNSLEVIPNLMIIHHDRLNDIQSSMSKRKELIQSAIDEIEELSGDNSIKIQDLMEIMDRMLSDVRSVDGGIKTKLYEIKISLYDKIPSDG